ncbi:MAG TPA: alpha-L-arabinofuranosidase C-terminal domain-containing protein [Mycobacteriales bacterium]|nr:alpha-L-arabinofuranosidase C-terminal domain-containing protein [Mycobacteriales bacterium]
MTVTVTIDPHRRIGTIDQKIYGHFLESNFFGNIDGGVLDEGSPLSHSGPGPLRGLRTDVIEACRELAPPIVRWPGGNFTSAYHWEDGVGPIENRPRRFELAWHGVEDNRFGTDEFLTWCAEIGAEPYLAHSARDVEEAARWVEYTNYGGDTEYTRRRAANGHGKPYGVKYWGVGNEVYGPWQVGHRTAEQYAADAREHALFMRAVDPELQLIGVGAPRRQPEWAETLLRAAGDMFDYLSLHLYAISDHLTDPSPAEFDAVVAQACYVEEEIGAYADLVATTADRMGVRRPPAIAMDEWNIRHHEPTDWPEPQPGADGGIADRERPEAVSGKHRVNRWSPRTLADALYYAGAFHAMHRASGHAVPVGMANTVNLVNANGLLCVRPGGLVRSSSYRIFDLYQNHTGPNALAVELDSPTRRQVLRHGAERERDGRPRTSHRDVPLLDVIATGGRGEGIQVVAINRDHAEPVRIRLQVSGAAPVRATVSDLGADATNLFAVNTISEPDHVRLQPRGERQLADGCYELPAHSITLLELPA